jgi:hypothetical protein
LTVSKQGLELLLDGLGAALDVELVEGKTQSSCVQRLGRMAASSSSAPTSDWILEGLATKETSD